jgi:hypothetical protein
MIAKIFCIYKVDIQKHYNQQSKDQRKNNNKKSLKIFWRKCLIIRQKNQLDIVDRAVGLYFFCMVKIKLRQE